MITDAACCDATYGCVSSGRGILLNFVSSTRVRKHCFAKAQQNRCTDHDVTQDDRWPGGRRQYHLRPWCDFDQILRYISKKNQNGGRNGDHPNNHAVETQCIDHVDGLGPKPETEDHGQQQTSRGCMPPPRCKSSTGKYSHADGYHDRETNNANKLIGKYEQSSLPRFHDSATRDPYVDITRRDVARIHPQLDPLIGEYKSGNHADYSGHQKNYRGAITFGIP